ncbi:MAG: acyl-CoA dehydrogenase family protein, partial [Sphingomonadaceae bacterium]|nr:acyl-CoA dehydrogenase family protein [Sphingomonadaceae bacterium]
KRGWLAPQWPRKYGGMGMSVSKQIAYLEELDRAGVPRAPDMGIVMLGPLLINYGSEEQRQTYLPRILACEDVWCQGYSEPNAGSDLASLRLEAVLDGDHWIVNGQKTWTTLGQHADWIFCLVRTSNEGKRQEGISFLLIDMKTPGIEVRPIKLLDGDHEVNEVFFTDVKVPVTNLVGEENKGWTYAKYLLTYERTNIAGVGSSMAMLDRLKEVARTTMRGGKPLIEDPLYAARLAKLEIDLENMKTTNLRVLDAAGAG